MISLVDNVLYEALPYAPLAFGLVLTFRFLKLIDLTFAASFAVAPALAAVLLVHGCPFVLAALAAAGATVALAGLTLALMALLELEPLLASLITSITGFSVALLLTQGTLSLGDAANPLDPFSALDLKSWADGLPTHPAEIALFVVIATSIKLGIDAFLGSELGLPFRAMEDERSRRTLLPAVGSSYWLHLSGGLIAGNMLSAASGVLVMLKEGQVTANRGFDALLTVFAAYLFGSVLFERRARMPGLREHRLVDSFAVLRPTSAALVGVLFYFSLLAIVSREDLPGSTPKLLMVGLLIVALIATRWDQISGRIWLKAGLEINTVKASTPFAAAGVSVAYPGFPQPIQVLEGASLELAAGSVTQLLGPNGSGKSTLLRFLAGRVPGLGKITIPLLAARGGGSRLGLMGYLSQDASFASSGTLTVDENLALFVGGPRRWWRRWRPPARAELPPLFLPVVESAGLVPTAALSGGQRQVLGLLAMVVRRDAPQVILLDEPLTHLDEVNAGACVDLIERLRADGRTLLIVQHDVRQASTQNGPRSRSQLAAMINNELDITSIQEPHGE